MLDQDVSEAVEAERLGDAANSRQPAMAHYREALRLLLPPGIVWSSREAYDRRLEAFERVQEKIYALEGRIPPYTEAPKQAEVLVDTPSDIGQLPSGTPALSVWDLSPGLVIRIYRTFIDFDGQEIQTGEVLHFLGSNYFPYDSGHTLFFAEKTIRLAGIVDENELVIANAGNAWFQQIS